MAGIDTLQMTKCGQILLLGASHYHKVGIVFNFEVRLIFDSEKREEHLDGNKEPLFDF